MSKLTKTTSSRVQTNHGSTDIHQCFNTWFTIWIGDGIRLHAEKFKNPKIKFKNRIFIFSTDLKKIEVSRLRKILNQNWSIGYRISISNWNWKSHFDKNICKTNSIHGLHQSNCKKFFKLGCYLQLIGIICLTLITIVVDPSTLSQTVEIFGSSYVKMSGHFDISDPKSNDSSAEISK